MASAEEAIKVSATSKVFNTSELLENILINVFNEGRYKVFHFGVRYASLRAIYRLQRVNSTFRNTIARSKTLRIAMFKETQSGGEGLTLSEGDRTKWERQKDTMLSANPLLYSWTSVWLVRLRTDHDYDKSEGVVDLFLSAREDGLIEERFHSVSSWRDMLLTTQPLWNTARIHMALGKMTCGPYDIELKEDMTLDDLVEVMREAAQRGMSEIEREKRNRERFRLDWLRQVEW